MWTFKKTQSPPPIDPRRYQTNPINLFFEDLILDIVERLPADRSSKIDAMNLHKVFSTKSNAWRDVIRETLHLSGTFDYAVWDLWVRNRGQYPKNADGDRSFAQNFADMYMADDSKIDVWPEGALEAAKSRINKFRDEK